MNTKNKTREVGKRIAYVLRMLSVPPAIVTVLILILNACRRGFFQPRYEMWLVIFFLAGMPVLAYPVSYLAPKLREKGREGQRKLAFVFSAVGYFGGWVYSVTFCRSPQIVMIYTTYFVSLLLLVLCNGGLKVKASGHGCSITGAVILGGFYLGWGGLLAGLGAYGAIFWASMKAKRHTPREFLLGTAICAAAAAFAWLCCGRPPLAG